MVNERQLSGRIILAPVGDQPSAVFTPLVACGDLRPRPADQVILIASRKTQAVAEAVKEHILLRRIVSENQLSVKSAAFPRLGPACLQKLQERCKSHHVVILANGGPGTWIYQLLPELMDGESPLELMVSRGQEGVWFECGLQRSTRSVSVGDIGIDPLLLLLGLSWNARKGVLKKRGIGRLGGLKELQEHAGELWAAIDASNYRAATYRTNLAFARLRAMGLERRRVCLVNAPPSIRKRALEDGISVAASKSPRSQPKLRKWISAVAAGQAGMPSTTVQLPAVWTPRPFQGRPKAPWKNGTLVTVMGPQAGTTLTAIWAHRPSRLHVLYDETQPLAVLATARLAEDPAVRDHISAIGFAGVDRTPGSLLGSIRDALRSLSSKDVQVNLTPGDKLLSLGLFLWALEDRRKRACWHLEGGQAKPILPGRTPLSAGPVPLRTWFFLHSPADVDMSRAADWVGGCAPRQATRLAHAAVRWLAHTTGSAFLNDLFIRRYGLRIAGGIVRVGKKRFPLSSLAPAEMAAAFRHPGGAWLEWITGAMLSRHGVSEVIVNVRDRTAAGDRDEIDVCSHHDGCLTVWECKTEQHRLENNLFEASSRTTRLFGYRAKTVLLMPRLPGTKPNCFEPVTGIDHLWRHRNGYGLVAAASLLVRRDHTLRLAGGKVP